MIGKITETVTRILHEDEYGKPAALSRSAEAGKPDMLRLAVAAVLEADKEFRANMPPEWEGDPLSDEIDGLRLVFSALSTPVDIERLTKALRSADEWMSCVESHLQSGSSFKRDREEIRAALAAQGEKQP